MKRLIAGSLALTVGVIIAGMFLAPARGQTLNVQPDQQIGAWPTVRLADPDKPKRPRAHASGHLTITFDGCRSALKGTHPYNGDNDIYAVSKALGPGAYFAGWTYDDLRVDYYNVRVTALFWAPNQGRYDGVAFQCRRVSDTNVDDWVYRW